MCFPLPLAPFEAYQLADDHPGSPMNFYFRLQFTGRVDRTRLEQALGRVVRRQPLLRAVVRDDDGDPRWVPTDVTPEIVWHRGGRGDEAPVLPALDIRRQPGLRLAVSLAGVTTTIWFQFHHVAVDGIGAMQVVEELLVAYDAVAGLGTRGGDLEPLDPHLLHERAAAGGSTWSRLRSAATGFLASYGVWQYLTHLVQPLVPSPGVARQTSVAPERPARPAFVSRRLTSRQVRELKWMARRQGRTVNDLLVTELFHTLESWNARRGGTARLGHLRLAVPVNLRPQTRSAMPACNQVAMVFLDRRTDQIRRPAALARSLARDLWFVKKFGLARVFLWSLALCQRLPGGLARVLPQGRSLATAVLSNLGVQLHDTRLTRADGRVQTGGLVLETIDFLPPVRPLTEVSCGVVTYGEELSVGLNYRADKLSAAAAEQLLEEFLARVEAWTVGRCGVPRAVAPAPREARPVVARHASRQPAAARSHGLGPRQPVVAATATIQEVDERQLDPALDPVAA